MSVHEHLKARRAAIIEQARAILNASPAGISPEAATRFDGLMAEADRLSREIHLSTMNPQGQRLRAGLNMGSSQAAQDDGNADLRAFNNFLKHGVAGLGPEDRAIMARRYDAGSIQAAQGTGSGGAGGFAVPDAALAPLVEALKQIGGVLPHCTIVPSQTGADLPIPTDNETAVEGEIVNENTEHSSGDVTLSQVVLSSFLYSSKIVRISVQLMDDAGFEFGVYVMKKLGERIGRITAKHWVTGDGALKPRGVVTAATVGKTAASGTAVTYDELVDLLHSVDPIYRVNGKWLMNDVTYGALRKLKDGQQRALYGDMAGAAPNMLLGHQISIDPNMPAMTTGNKAILFGDLKTYYVRLVKEPRVLRLEERYAEFLQLGFLAFLRADGDLVDGGVGAIKALQMA